MTGDLFLPLLQPPFWKWSALALGLIVGSFANVCIHRLPAPAVGRHASLRLPALRRADPSLGQRARAELPRAPRPLPPLPGPDLARYPLVEAANGAAYFALAALMGPHVRTVAMMALVTALIVLSLIDLEWQILPNVITLPGVAVGLLASFLPGPPSTLGALAAAAGGYLALMALALAWKRFRHVDALGEGDWKMTAMLGAFLGWQGMVLTVFLASVMGTLVGVALIVFAGRTREHKLPLGTFLGLAGIAVVFVGDPLLAWYRGLLAG